MLGNIGTVIRIFMLGFLKSRNQQTSCVLTSGHLGGREEGIKRSCWLSSTAVPVSFSAERRRGGRRKEN